MPEAYLQKEKRVDPRISIKIPVIFRVIDDQEEIETLFERKRKEKHTHTLNISLGGMSIVAGEALKDQSILSLDILISGSEKILKAIAEVVWSNEMGGGIRFLTMNEDDIETLKDYLDKAASKR